MASNGTYWNLWGPDFMEPDGIIPRRDLVGLPMSHVRSRRTNESCEALQDEFSPRDLAGRMHRASLAEQLGRATNQSREISQDEWVV